MPQLADLYRRAARRGVLLQIGNNVGYFGPYEGELRGSGSRRSTTGAAAPARARSASKPTAR